MNLRSAMTDAPDFEVRQVVRKERRLVDVGSE